MKINILFVALAMILLAACSVPVQPANIPAAQPSSTPTTAAQPPASVATPTNQQPGEPTTRRPNIIFILADDLDYASMAYMPKLKSLVADQGMTFKNFLVSMSLCCPSRATILRGQYGHNTQILGNNQPAGGFEKFYELGEEKSTIAVWLQDAGYRTLLAGKYLNGFPQRNNLMYIPPGWTEWYSAMRGNAYSEYNYTLNENGKQVDYGKKPEDYGTDVYARKSVDFIQRSVKEGKPFFIYLAPYAPHSPSTPAPRHEKLFADVRAPRLPNYNEEDVSDKPNFIRLRPSLNQRNSNAIDAEYRLRLQSLQAIDDAIESLVNTTQAAGQLDHTYIFFTSDNGFHLGNHRQIAGKIAPYEEELRVTMIVRGPGVSAGKTAEQLTGNIDLAPTWAELGGAKMPDFVDGRSLVPLWGDNSSAQWRQAFLVENGLYQTTPRSGGTIASNAVAELLEPDDQDETEATALPTAQRAALGVPSFRGIRMSNAIYVEYITGEKEFYDLAADPYQLNNLASKANPALLAQYAARLKELMVCKATQCRALEDVVFK